MPFESSTFQLPGGARCCCIEWIGVATEEDAAAVLELYRPTGPYHGLPILVRCQKMERMDPGARAAFGGLTEGTFTQWVAVVGTNPVIRVTNNFIMRMARNSRTRMFGDEAKAIRWLDERTRENAAKAKPAP